jgi:hypothetical protein
VFKDVSKSLKKVRLKIWFGDDNELFSAEFVWDN